jgi:hypothetical protein
MFPNSSPLPHRSLSELASSHYLTGPGSVTEHVQETPASIGTFHSEHPCAKQGRDYVLLIFNTDIALNILNPLGRSSPEVPHLGSGRNGENN